MDKRTLIVNYIKHSLLLHKERLKIELSIFVIWALTFPSLLERERIKGMTSERNSAHLTWKGRKKILISFTDIISNKRSRDNWIFYFFHHDIMWHVDPLLRNGRETNDYATELLSNGCSNKHFSAAPMALQQINSVFWEVRAELLLVGQVRS
jgi:hypothetical protein